MNNSRPPFLRPVPSLAFRWEFETEGPSAVLRRAQFRALLRARRFPPWRELRAPRAERGDRWVVYFAFAPEARLEDHHRFTLSRIRDEGIPLLVVCASPTPDRIPSELCDFADSLYWKGLSGWDFSGYGIALRALAHHAPGSTVLVVNDSIFGPFQELSPFLASPPWELTGFTASRAEESHIQSYAFLLQGVSRAQLRPLKSIFPPWYAFPDYNSLILRHELRMARVAARNLSVGAHWAAPRAEVGDPSLTLPFELLDAGHPFLKRSLLGKHAHFQSRDRMHEFLHHQSHPIPRVP